MSLTRKDDVEVFVSSAAPLELDDSGKLTEYQVATLSAQLLEHIEKLNGNVSHGTGVTGHRGNIDESFYDVITPAAANTEFIVPHTLGRLPTGVHIVRANIAANIYDSNAGSWDSDHIYLKCNVATAQLKLCIF